MASTADESIVHTKGVTEAPAADTKMSVTEYLATRLTSLKPPMTPAGNPFKQLGLLNREQWAFFAASYACHKNLKRALADQCTGCLVWLGVGFF